MPVSKTYFLDLLVERYPPLAPCYTSILEAAEAIIDCHSANGSIFICGNGGSAADAEHIAAELVKSFAIPRPVPIEDVHALCNTSPLLGQNLAQSLQRGVRAFALSGSSPLGTAIVNDCNPDILYAQMTYVYGRPGDILIGISTSGNSKNVVAALTVAKSQKLKTIGLTGHNQAAVDDLSDVLIKAPATETYKIQEFHLPIYHTICLTVEEELFG
jgi:D-sedoheptulose 7-phosphate isomerase